MKGGNTDEEKGFYKLGAESGYSLSLSEIEGLKKLLKKVVTENRFYEPTLPPEKAWQSFAKANNIKL